MNSSISPCLWFEDNLEEAAVFYTSIFPNSSIRHLSRYTEAGPGQPGTVMAGEFTIGGMTFRGIDGGPESVCGWLKDRFGLSWQIVPQRLYELVSDPNPVRAKAATDAMFTMRK